VRRAKDLALALFPATHLGLRLGAHMYIEAFAAHEMLYGSTTLQALPELNLFRSKAAQLTGSDAACPALHAMPSEHRSEERMV
jgi:hypothetical protein